MTGCNRGRFSIPPLVGLLNLPARPLLPGGMFAVNSVIYSKLEEGKGLLVSERIDLTKN